MFNMMIPRRSNSMSIWNDPFFSDFFGRTPFLSTNSFRVDVKDTPDAYELTAELPGMKQEQIEVTAHDGVLTITAHREHQETKEENNYVYSERSTGTYQRAFELEGIKEQEISAKYEDGLLKLHLPKLSKEETQNQPRRIAIESGK